MINRKGFGSNGVVCEVEVKKDFHPGKSEEKWIKIYCNCFTTNQNGPETRSSRCTHTECQLDLNLGKAGSFGPMKMLKKSHTIWQSQNGTCFTNISFEQKLAKILEE